MKPDMKKTDIISKLRWFHGDDFDKYPIDEDSFTQEKSAQGK